MYEAAVQSRGVGCCGMLARSPLTWSVQVDLYRIRGNFWLGQGSALYQGPRSTHKVAARTVALRDVTWPIIFSLLKTKRLSRF